MPTPGANQMKLSMERPSSRRRLARAVVMFFTFSALKVPAATVISSSPTHRGLLVEGGGDDGPHAARIFARAAAASPTGCSSRSRRAPSPTGRARRRPPMYTTSTSMPEADSSVPSRPPSPVRTPSASQVASVWPLRPLRLHRQRVPLTALRRRLTSLVEQHQLRGSGPVGELQPLLQREVRVGTGGAAGHGGVSDRGATGAGTLPRGARGQERAGT